MASAVWWWKIIHALLLFSSVSGVSSTCGVGLAPGSTWKMTFGMFCSHENTAIGTYVDSDESNKFANIYVKYDTNRAPEKYLYLEVTPATAADPETLMWYISSFRSQLSNTIAGTYDARFQVSGTNRTVSLITGATIFVKCAPAAGGIGTPPGVPISISTILDTQCKCDANYELFNGACRQCIVNRFKTKISNSSCSGCPAGKLYTDIRTCTCLPGSTGGIGEECAPCVAGTFNSAGGIAQCVACPLHTNSPVNSNTLTNCTCNSGYDGPHGAVCAMCAAGKYKSARGSESCADCAVGKFSNATGATTLNVCRDCTNNSSSPAGSNNQSACKCDPGSYGANGDACVKCGMDTYSTDRGSSSCTQCPFGKSAILGGTSIDACVCMRGHDSQCGCAAGSMNVYQYELTLDTFACFGQDIGNGVYVSTGLLHENSLVYYSSAPKPRFLFKRDTEWWISTKFNDLAFEMKFGGCAFTPDRVEQLPSVEFGCRDVMLCNGDVRWNNPGQTNVANVSKCVCNTNFVRNMYGICTQCAAGFYKLVTATGSSACSPCSANSGTLDPSNGTDGCGCNAGFSGPNDGVCTKCALGTHKFERGPAPCVKCPDVLHLLHSAFNISLQIPNCNTCEVGFIWNHAMQQCIQCASNEFNNQPGDSVCFKCVATPQYFPLQQNLQSWFKFDKGGAYGWGNGVIDSSINQKNGIISFNVFHRDPDPLDYVDFVEGDACLGISSHGTTLNSVNLGGDASILTHFKFYPGGDGRFLYMQERNGVDIRINRVGNQLHFTGIYLPLSLYTSVPNDGLQPNRWYHFAWIVERARARWTIYFDGERTLIPLGFVPPVLSAFRDYQIKDARHKMDDLRFYSRALSQYEVRNAFRQRDVNAICGLTVSSGTTCPRLCSVSAGYELTASGANVQLCPVNTYHNGFALNCQSCPLGSSINISGSKDISACVCAPGYSRTTPGISSCKPCPAGTFKSVSGQGVCAPCAAGQFSNAGADVCGCDAGFTGDLQLGPCQACEAGKYKNTTGSGPCVSCGVRRNSATGSRQVSDCKCNEGFMGPDTGSCESNSTCPLNAHKPELNSRTSCRCRPGYTGPNMWGPCEICEAGKFKESLGSAACGFCPPDASSALGSSNRDACKCAVGFHQPVGGFCTMCAIGTYKDTIGSHACTTCPANAISFVPARSREECVCDLGFTGTNGQECIACPAGKYKAVVGSSACISCQTFSVSQEGSKSEDDCFCTAGYSRNKDDDVPNTNSDLARQKTGVGGWRLVRFMPQRVGRASWYRMCDLLHGNIKVGEAYNKTEDWTIPFGEHNEVLMGNFNLDVWMHVPKYSTGGYHSGWGNNQQDAFGTSFKPYWHRASIRITDHDRGGGRPFFQFTDGGWDRGPDRIYMESVYEDAGRTLSVGGLGVWARHSHPAWCRICQPNTYNSIMGSNICTKCADNSEAPGVGNSNRIACICNAGYYGPSGGPCVACPIGTFNTQKGATTCQSCAVNMTSSPGSSVCECGAGRTGPNHGPCTLCPVGTYKGVPGAGPCRTCLMNTTSFSPGNIRCRCELGLLGIGVVLTHEIPLDSLRPSFVMDIHSSHSRQHHSSAYGQNHTLPSRQYLRGHPPVTQMVTFTYALPSGYNKVSVWSNNYRDESLLHVDINGVQLALPGNTESNRCTRMKFVTTTFLPGAVITVVHKSGDNVVPSQLSLQVEQEARDKSDCIPCPLGFIVSNVTGLCIQCEENTYNPHPQGLVCISCPAETRAPPRSSDLTHCKCRGQEFGTSGLTGPDGGVCRACPPNFYKTVVGSSSCDRITNTSNAVSLPHAVGTALRSILDHGFRGNWTVGNSVRLHRSGRRGYNDLVLTYNVRGLSNIGVWFPPNANPLVRTNDKYMFKVASAILMQKNATESGFATAL